MADKALNDIREPLPAHKGSSWIFVILVIGALFILLVGMAWAPNDSTQENRELAEAPQLFLEDQFNVGYLSDLGEYFADHFAYRENLVDADARLFSSVFGVSTAENVVLGTEGWLYYAGTLADYQNKAPLHERQARNIAHNLRMLQDWCSAQGADFVFTVAPDKNSLYGSDMPYYYPQVANDDMEMLEVWLDAYEVRHVDMHSVLTEAGGVQYFLRDSHWSDKGALLGHDAIADALSLETAGIDLADLIERKDYVGDLNRMLYPVSAIPETDWYAVGVNDGSGETGTMRSGAFWDYVEGADPNDGIVVTEPTESNPYASVAASNGTMLMFRDSFAIGLLPFFACETETARFDKMVPYNGLQLLDEAYDCVVVERAQRHVADLANEAFIMPCPAADADFVDVIDAADASATCDVQVEGSLISVSGCVQGIALQPDDDVLVRVSDEEGLTRTYEAFACTGDGSDNGYTVYAGSGQWLNKAVRIEVFVRSDFSSLRVATFDLIIS